MLHTITDIAVLAACSGYIAGEFADLAFLIIRHRKKR